MLKGKDIAYFALAEEITGLLSRYLCSIGLTTEDWGDAYLEMCNEHVREQVRFGKTGSYEKRSFETCYSSVYADDRRMQTILLGLALSLLLWKHHYQIFDFYRRCVAKTVPRTYCEIGAGHGLFLVEAIKAYSGMHAMVIDISPKSIEICRRIVSFALPDMKNIEFVLGDILKSDLHGRRYDFVVMGEVIEHVDKPLELLNILKQLLGKNGVAFITTCCNSPSVDHVYLFKNVDEVRALLEEAGLQIVEELVVYNGMKWIIQGELRKGINYAALVS